MKREIVRRTKWGPAAAGAPPLLAPRYLGRVGRRAKFLSLSLFALVVLCLPAGAATAASDRKGGKGVRIQVLSNRADLISGGNALVRIRLPKGVDRSKVRVHVRQR